MEKFKNNLSKNILVFKKFPNSFTSSDKQEFVRHFGATNVRIKNCLTFGTFKDDTEAQKILVRLHQLEILGSILTVEYANNHDTNNSSLPSNSFIENNIEKNVEEKLIHSYENLNGFVKKLNTLNGNINFNQPPLPYLIYKYPKVNRDIIDSICVALESIPKFYNQVLHLMNRMNIPAPFCINSKKLKYEQSYLDIATQTDFPHDSTEQINVGIHNVESESESELDIELNEQTLINEAHFHSRKRKANNYCKDKMFRSIINAKKHKDNKFNISNQTPTINLLDSFDKINTENNPKKIILNVPRNLNSCESIKNEINLESVESRSIIKEPVKLITKDEIERNRIPIEQLKNILIFKNYNPGIKSNKLYIKNLSKTTTHSDLLELFSVVLGIDPSNIDVKLMKEGRMKGQAFIKIINNKIHHDLDLIKNKMEIALNATNGYILNDKPMVVLYGKCDEN